MRGIAIVLLVTISALTPSAGSAQCSRLRDLAVDQATRAQTSSGADTTGGLESWRDVLARLVSKIETVDFDPGKEATTLTWNVTPEVDVKAVVPREPSLFEPLKKAIGSDSELIDSLSNGIAEGDDWELSVAGVWGKKGTDPNGGSAHGLAGYYKSVLDQAADVTEAAAGRYDLTCEQLGALPVEALAIVGRQMRDADDSTWELSLRAFQRERRDAVGPDSQGVKLKFIYGMTSEEEKEEGEEQGEVATAAVVAARSDFNTDLKRRVAATLLPYFDQVKGTSPAFDEQLKANRDAARVQLQGGPTTEAFHALNRQADAASKRIDLRTLLAGDAAKPLPAKQSVAFELDWQQTDDYLFPGTNGPLLTLPEEESLVIKGSYSVELPRDGTGDSAAPTYELSGSYEDVDGDAQRQSRLLLALKATARVEALGKDSDVTFGLHWANKPEYLVLGDDDRGITARLALTFKIGDPPK